MISFFSKSGDRDVAKLLDSIVYGEAGIGARLERELEGDNYGGSVKRIVIALYLHGRFEIFGPENIEIGRWSRVRRGLIVNVPLNWSGDSTLEARRKDIAETIGTAIDCVEQFVQKRKLDLDVKRLRRDVEDAIEKWLAGNKVCFRFRRAVGYGIARVCTRARCDADVLQTALEDFRLPVMGGVARRRSKDRGPSTGAQDDRFFDGVAEATKIDGPLARPEIEATMLR